jgi:hypothetical protein
MKATLCTQLVGNFNYVPAVLLLFLFGWFGGGGPAVVLNTTQVEDSPFKVKTKIIKVKYLPLFKTEIR